MTRVGVVDLGTNSTRLLVADVDDGRVEEVERRLQITRLGEGVDRRRLLLPTAIARVRNVLADYRRELERLGATRTLAVATSAVRDAENGEAFLGEVEWSYGFSTRLLSGEEEASWMFRGVANGRPLEEETLVVDIGGGSTELVVGGPDDVVYRTSLDLGCVRLTERFLHTDPPTREELERCAYYVREQLPTDQHPAAAIGVAGTVTTLATLDLGLEAEDPALVHGHRMPTDVVAAGVERLSQQNIEEIRARPGIHPERAPVIVAGAIVALEVLRHFRLPQLEVSERDIMHGAALAAAELPEPVEGDAPPGAYTCC